MLAPRVIPWKMCIRDRNILHEYYVSISVDRSSRDFDVLATANGGTEVEEVARKHPESVKRLHISALEDFDLEAATKMAESIGFYHADSAQAAQILLNMWRLSLIHIYLPGLGGHLGKRHRRTP